MSRKFNRFQPRSGKYNCQMCGHVTRATGNNDGTDLCPLCYDECELENSFSDGRITKEKYAEELLKLDRKREKRDKKV